MRGLPGENAAQLELLDHATKSEIVPEFENRPENLAQNRQNFSTKKLEGICLSKPSTLSSIPKQTNPGRKRPKIDESNRRSDKRCHT